MDEAGLANALCQAASDWLTKNNPEGNGWFDARNVDDLVSVLIPVIKQRLGQSNESTGGIDARTLLEKAGADIVGDREESAYVFVTYLQRELDKLADNTRPRLPEGWAVIADVGGDIKIPWPNGKGFTKLTSDSWKEGVEKGLLYDLTKNMVTKTETSE